MLSMNPGVAAAMRRSLSNNLDDLTRIFGIGVDECLTLEERVADVLFNVLFLQREIKNPVVVFQSRLKDGDFMPLREDENPHDLPAGREPLTDVELDEMAAEAVSLSERLWQGKATCKPAELVRNALLYVDDFGLSASEDDELDDVFAGIGEGA